MNIKNTFFKGMNKDLDERFLQPSAYRDAVNIRIMSTEGNDVGAIENVKGNTAVTMTLPGGTNKAIGSCEHQQLNAIYFFIWNSNENHTIWRYNSVTNDIDKIMQDSILNFFNANIITGANAITESDGDTLLYWTDDVNPPRKINVDKAFLHQEGDYSQGYPLSFSTGTEDQRRQFIDAIKYPPLTRPTFEFRTDDTQKQNKLLESMFQFRYRYIYDDGEVSAFSPMSDIAVSKTQLTGGAIQETYNNYFNNYLRVTVLNGHPTVDRIEIIARDGNDGDWVSVETLSNKPNTSTQRIDFYNDKTYGAVPVAETNKLYDAVPILAKAQDINANRLFYANVVDGYDNPKPSKRGLFKRNNNSVLPKYFERPDSADIKEEIPAIGYPQSFPYPSDTFTITHTLSTVSAPNPGDEYTLNVSGTYIKDDGFNSNYFYYSSYTAGVGDSVQDVANAFGNQLQGDIIGQFGLCKIITFSVSAVGDLTLTIDVNTANSMVQILALSVINSSNKFALGSLTTSSTFKAGAKHEFARVYYDRANRSATVYKPENSNPYVKFFSERTDIQNINFEGLGKVTMDWRVGDTPPDWATHYQHVYTKNQDIDSFLQFTTMQAYVARYPLDYDPASSAGDPNEEDRNIYVSMRGLKGNPDSYKEQFDALSDYIFENGARIRIIKYYDNGAYTYANSYLDFEVVDFRFLNSNDENPIYNSTNDKLVKQTTGWFLVVRDPGVPGWRWEDVRDFDHLWSNEENLNFGATKGAMFEVYNPKKRTSDNLYYEFSDVYDILDPGTEDRRHAGQVRDQGEEVTYGVTGYSPSLNYIQVDVSTGDPLKIVIGDALSFSSIPGQTFTVKSILQTGVVNYQIILNQTIPASYGGGGSVSVAIKTAAGGFDCGDTWMKPRQLRINNRVGERDFDVDYVEDYSMSDFFASESSCIGRPHAYSEFDGQKRREATIWWSEPFFPEIIKNGFSAFDLANAPYKDLNQGYGTIQRIKSRNESIIIYQEDKVSNVMIDRQIIDQLSDGNLTVATQSVVSEPRYYVGDYGISKNPESFAEFSGTHYFLDLKRGKVVRLGGDGLTVISDYGMRSYFDEKSRDYLRNWSGVNILGGFDIEHDHYLISFPGVTTRGLLSGDASSVHDFGGLVEEDGDVFLTDVVEADGVSQEVTWGNEDRTFAEVWETYNTWGGPVADVDGYAKSGSIVIPRSDLTARPPRPSYVVYTRFESRGGFINRVQSIYSPFESRILIGSIAGVISIGLQDGGWRTASAPDRYGRLDCVKSAVSQLEDITLSGGSSVLPPSLGPIGVYTGVTVPYKTVAFHEPSNQWVSFYTFEPEIYAKVNSSLFTASGGTVYEHNTNNTYNTFYGTFGDSELTFFANAEPSLVKFFNAISLEGDAAWDATSTSSLGLESYIDASSFQEKEGFWYEGYSGGTTASTVASADDINSANIIGLGAITAVDASSVTVAGMNAGQLGVFVGDNIFTGGATSGGEVITAIEYPNKLVMADTSGFIVTNYIYIIRSQAIEGDDLRGYYLKVLLKNDSTSAIELHAVNVISKPSYLSNP